MKNPNDVEVRVCKDGYGTEILIGGKSVLGGFEKNIPGTLVSAFVKAHEFLVHWQTGKFPIVFHADGYFGCTGVWCYGDHGL